MDDDVDLVPFCAFCGLSSAFLDLFEEDDPRMAKVENLKLYADVLGNYWCEEHWYRGKSINWGAKHGWPLLHLWDGTVGNDNGDIYVIPDGVDGWFDSLVASKSEEVGCLVEGVIEMLESERQAS